MTKQTPGSCSVDGYPLLTLQGTSGSLVASSIVDVSPSAPVFPTASDNNKPHALTVQSGASISFRYSYSDVSSAGACPSVQTINVQFATGQSASPVTLKYPAAPCNAGRVVVSAFQAG
jgi:hypothetical protein